MVRTATCVNHNGIVILDLSHVLAYHTFMSATLGGLLKDYRLQKNISQLEISFAVGWKEPSRLSRIEQGRVGRPKMELLNKIMAAMKLDEEERNRLLMAGGYIPTQEETEKVRKAIQPILKDWQYPAIIYDFTWRLVDMNKQAKHLYGPVKEQRNGMMPHMLEVLFDEKNVQMKSRDAHGIEEWHSFLLWTLIQFKHAQKSRTREKWFTLLIGKLMNIDLFRTLWSKANVRDEQGKKSYYTREVDVFSGEERKKLRFNLFILPLYKDPRFEIEFYTPHTVETFTYFK